MVVVVVTGIKTRNFRLDPGLTRSLTKDDIFLYCICILNDTMTTTPEAADARFLSANRSRRHLERKKIRCLRISSGRCCGKIDTNNGINGIASMTTSSAFGFSYHCCVLAIVVALVTAATEEAAEDKFDTEGTFNGYPIRYRELYDPSTTVHCVGENYQNKTSWIHRSCEFTDLFCFDTNTKDFVVFQSEEDRRIYHHVDSRPLLDISQSYLQQSSTKRNTVSLGGINLKWSMHPKKGIPRLEWFPEIRDASNYNKDTQPLRYYELSPNVVMVPFHSMNGANPGHLVWDDFLPIYTLLTMFQLDELSPDLLMMRYILKDADKERGLWASCDWNEDKTKACQKMMQKFLPLMMGEKQAARHGLSTTEDFQFEVQRRNDGDSSSLVCSRYGVAGIGPLTDHGTYKLHGWEDADYTTTHNHGRGGMLYEFRTFMLSNMNLPVSIRHKPPFRIIFSQHSSEAGRRSYDFKKQKEILQQSFNPGYVSVEAYTMSELSLREQLEMVSQSSIFVTGSGGGAVTGMFLPKESSIIIYYPESGGVVGNQPNGKPARLDWGKYEHNMEGLLYCWCCTGMS